MTTPAHPSDKSEKNSPRFDLKPLVKSGAVVPMAVIATVGLAALVMVTSIVIQTVRNHGLIPPPATLDAYNCQGFAAPFELDFRHGLDRVQLKAGARTFSGELQNGHIEWAEPAQASAQLGFAAPTAMVYDDAHSLRLLDASGAERTCQRQGNLG